MLVLNVIFSKINNSSWLPLLTFCYFFALTRILIYMTKFFVNKNNLIIFNMKKLIMFLVVVSLVGATGYGVSKARELDSATARGLSLIQNINAGDESNNLELRIAGTDDEWGSEDVFIGQYDLSPASQSSSNLIELRNTRVLDDDGCIDACGWMDAVYKVKLIEQCMDDEYCDPNTELEVTIYYDTNELEEGAILWNNFSLMFYEIAV